MSKFNELQFAQSLPSTFFRRSKRPYTLNDQDRQISDAEISQKLQLILISMREQSAKITSYFQQEIQKLQLDVNEQNNIITLLQEENKLLRSHVNLYENKFGGLSKIGQKSQKNLIPEVQIFNNNTQQNPNKQKIQNKNINTYLKINDQNKKCNELSKMSTNYNSNIEISSLKTQKLSKQHHEETCSKHTDQNSSQNESTCSNFYKKTVPFHHRRQSSMQQKQSLGSLQYQDINILPLINRCQKAQKTEISKISEFDSRKSTIIDIFKQEQSQLQNEEMQQEAYELGLESKGNGFFVSAQKYIQQQRQETLLIQNYQPQYPCNEIKLARYVESKQDLQEQEDFYSVKTDSDIKNFNNILDAKYSYPKENFCEQNQKVKVQKPKIQHKAEIKDLNDSCLEFLQKLHKGYSLNIGSVEKSFQNSYDSSQKKPIICGQKRLRALFTPLSQNLLSKKVNLPFNKNQQKVNCQFTNQTGKSNNMANLLGNLHMKNAFCFENQNPLELAVKKLKNTNANKIRY